MKKIWLIALVFVIGWACSSKKQVVMVQVKDATVAEDSIEYELVVFDAEFETWYLMRSGKALERSNNYYMNWNRQYINAWNHKAMTGRYGNLFNSTIDIDPNKDYGLDINKKLFYYFIFVERHLKIPILPHGPQGVF